MNNFLLKNLNLDENEFFFQFQSHPHYPSALAFSDTLNFLGIKNEVYELGKQFWDELPEEFITITNDNFSLIKKDKESYRVFSEEEKVLIKEELYKNSLDVVILFEKLESSKRSSSKNYQICLYLFLGFILLFSLWQNNWIEFLFNLLSVLGLYISLELFKKKFGIKSVVLNSVCGGNINKTSEKSCSKIIESDKINFLGLKFSDFSLFYFIAILVLGLFLPTTDFIFKILAFISIFVVIYSLYIQIIVEKALCKICLIIISVLILQIIISTIYFSINFSFSILLSSLFIFLTTFFAVVFINNLLNENENLKKSNVKNLKFKRNYDLFKTQLLKKEKINFKDNFNGFFIGKQNAQLHISLVSNPYCGYCKDAHEILEKLLVKYSDSISAQIRFNYSPENADSNLIELLEKLIGIYSNNKLEFMNALHFWFDKRDLKIFSEKYKTLENTGLSFLKNLTEDNLNNELNFTPIFLINGYQFPDKYDRDDIFYFIDDLLEDEDL